MEFTEALFAFQLVGEELARRGLVTSHGGNLSLRYGPSTSSGRRSGLLITRHGAMLGHLQGRDLAMAPLEGEAPGASWDLPWHQAIYRGAPGRDALVHAHPLAAVALSLSEGALRPRDKEGAFLLGEVPVLTEGTELEVELAAVMNRGKAVILRGHGSFVGGESLEEALHFTTTLEASARILLLERLWSGKPNKSG